MGVGKSVFFFLLAVLHCYIKLEDCFTAFVFDCTYGLHGLLYIYLFFHFFFHGGQFYGYGKEISSLGWAIKTVYLIRILLEP